MKPGNLLLKADLSSLKLADFGIFACAGHLCGICLNLFLGMGKVVNQAMINSIVHTVMWRLYKA